MRKILYIDESEYVRLNKVDARMDALISYVQLFEREQKSKGYGSFDVSVVKAIIGMYDE